MMFIRIGEFGFDFGITFALLAGAYFIVSALISLRQSASLSARSAQIIIMTAAGGGALMTLALAFFPDILSGAARHHDPYRDYSSHGAVFGILLGAWAASVALRRKPFEVTDALVGPLLVSLVIARVGCLFAGCCRGIRSTISLPLFGTISPFEPWPFWDILALLSILAAVSFPTIHARLQRTHGATLAVFLIVHGLLRLLLEFARVADQIAVTNDIRLAYCLVEILAGCAVAAIVCSRHRLQRN